MLGEVSGQKITAVSSYKYINGRLLTVPSVSIITACSSLSVNFDLPIVFLKVNHQVPWKFIVERAQW